MDPRQRIELLNGAGLELRAATIAALTFSPNACIIDASN